jgi:glycine/D-amino acid oxidase-like deaminating enzyme
VPVGGLIATAPLDESAAGKLLRATAWFRFQTIPVYFRLTGDRRRSSEGELSSRRRASTATCRDDSSSRHDGGVQWLTDVEIDYAWSGSWRSRDQLPRAGRLGGAYYAAGYGGHGIAMATCLGELVATRMSGAQTAHPLFDDRPPPIPLYHGRTWFLPIVGAYFRAMDWLR